MESAAVQDYVKQIYLLQTRTGKATTSEIAHRMGIAQPTVRVHLHRARKRLRELLGVEEVD